MWQMSNSALLHCYHKKEGTDKEGMDNTSLLFYVLLLTLSSQETTHIIQQANGPIIHAYRGSTHLGIFASAAT